VNAELQRNLWLEAAPKRLAWAGVALGMVYGVALLMANDSPRPNFASALAIAGNVVFVACAGVWAARAAGGSVLGEIADRTWDFQRLSALSPWSMTWGKLFGAASLAWLCGLTGLAFAGAYTIARRGAEGGWNIAAMLAAALFVQAVCMGAALIGVRKARAEGQTARAGGVIGGLAIGVVLALTATGSSGFRGGKILGLSEMFAAEGVTRWWTLAVDASAFRAAAAAAFAAWALVGAWRLMRLELQMRNTPLAWPAFLVFLALFVGGFLYLQGGLSAAFLSGAVAAAVCAYGAAFAEPADRVKLRLFAGAVRRGDWARATPLTPSPIAPVVLAGLLVAAAFATAQGGAGLGGRQDVGQAAALLPFLLRDLGVIALFRFGPRPKRGDISAILALALLYLLSGVMGGTSWALEGHAGWGSAAWGLVQAAVAWWFAARRIRAPEQSVATPG
jgi:hypothetical protein